MILVLFLRLNTRHGDFIIVPDLIGKNIQEFESELNKLDLQYIISDSGNYNPTFKINSVLDQLPKANSKVKQGRKIYLTLNASDFDRELDDYQLLVLFSMDKEYAQLLKKIEQ